MLFAWPLLPPPQGLQLGNLQAGVTAPAMSKPSAAVSTSSGSSTVVSTSQPSSPDAGTATGTSGEQPQQPPQQQQQMRAKQQSGSSNAPQLQPVRVCRPTARLAGQCGSRGGGGGSGTGNGQPPEQGERVAPPPTGGAGLQHSASSAFRALVSACGAAATCV
jgi:hypothetical protein